LLKNYILLFIDLGYLFIYFFSGGDLFGPWIFLSSLKYRNTLRFNYLYFIKNTQLINYLFFLITVSILRSQNWMFSPPISSCFVSKFCFATCVFFPFWARRKLGWHSGFVEAALKILSVCQLAFGFDLSSAWFGLLLLGYSNCATNLFRLLATETANSARLIELIFAIKMFFELH